MPWWWIGFPFTGLILIVPAILIPTVRPCARWFGAEESLVQYGFQYIAPLCWGSVGTCVFLCNGGFLQGEGRTHVFAMMELFSFFLNGLLFDPFLLLYGKLGVRGAAISTLCAEIIPALMLFAYELLPTPPAATIILLNNAS